MTYKLYKDINMNWQHLIYSFSQSNIVNIYMLLTNLLIITIPIVSMNAHGAKHSEHISHAPLLRINTSMHNAKISRISTDAKQHWLVTASSDKSVRSWNLKTGEWYKTYRLPSEPGKLGKAYAVAMSPDGEIIAVGGFTGHKKGEHNIYFFNRKSGNQIHRIRGLPSPIHHLEYSPIGHYFVATLGGENGIRVYRLPDYELHFKDEHYKGNVRWASFDRLGRLVTTADDRKIRLYNSHFSQINSFVTNGRRPAKAAFSPNGERIAVGYYDGKPKVDIFDGRLQHLYSANTGTLGDQGNLDLVAWSPDGKTLWASGKYYDPDVGKFPIMTWSDIGKQPPETRFSTTRRVMDLKVINDGGLIVGTADPSLLRFSSLGNIAWQQLAQLADFRGQLGEDSIQLSHNASHVRFKFKQNEKKYISFDVTSLFLGYTMPYEQLYKADTTSLDIDEWEDTLYPTLRDKVLPLKQDERSRSLAIAPDKRSFVLGTEWYLRWYKKKGKPIGKPVALPGIAWTINISSDGRWLVAGLGDGTLRWYDYNSREEKLALYINPEDKTWVLWTPEGFFSAQPGSEQLVGYQLNQEWDSSPEFITGTQLYESFYRPDLVLAKFENDKITLERALARVGDVRQLLQKERPPLLELADTSFYKRRIRSTSLRIPLYIDDHGSGIGPIEVRVNGTVQPTKNLTVRDSLGIYQVPVNVPANEASSVTFRVPNKKGTVYSETEEIEIISKQKNKNIKPNLYGLAIGVENYKDSKLKLQYSNDDVLALTDALYTHSTPLFNSVEITPLIDADKSSILEKFNSVQKKVKPEDVFILYLSGHGIAIDGKYHFLSRDFNEKHQSPFLTSAITHSDLVGFLKNMPAQRMIVIIDSCFANSFHNSFNIAYRSAIDRLVKNTGRAVFYASNERHIALEGVDGNSLYTHVLLKGLKGGAAGNNQEVTLDELKVYLYDKVPEVSLTKFGIKVYPIANINSKYPIPITVKGG